MNFITLDYVDIALAATLVLINAGLSLGLSLGLERRFLIAALRMAVQLTLVGLVLKALFATATPLLTGLAALHALTQSAVRDRAAIEARLALGAPWREALRPTARDTLRTALIPIINSMSATGLVALPGMMTGQILSGVDLIEAVKYQLLISFLIAGGTALGALAAVQAGVWRLCDNRHRLRLDRLAPPRD